jgi:hypothetical protein
MVLCGEQNSCRRTKYDYKRLTELLFNEDTSKKYDSY